MDVLMRVRRLPAIISVARLLRWNRLSVIEYVMELRKDTDSARRPR